MKRIIKELWIPMAMLWLSLPVFAYDFEVDGIYYNIISAMDLTLEVSNNPDNQYSGDVTLPSNVDFSGREFNVVAIGEKAFANCDGLNSIKIPSSIKTIKADAFNGTNLKYVEIFRC